MEFDAKQYWTKCHGVSLQALRDKDGLKTLKNGCELLEKLGINYWVSAGTMLGLYRDGGLIPHDTDIDVETMEISRGEEIRKIFTSNGYKLVKESYYKDMPMQLAFSTLEDNVIFDIYFYVKLDEETLINYNDFGVLKLPFKLIRDFHREVFCGISLITPHPVEEYLTLRYGNWGERATSKGAWHKQAANMTSYKDVVKNSEGI
jgi:hypothetical protein